MEFTSVVLPTPGPPVITNTLLARAIRTASRWLAANCRPVRRSTHGIALAASMGGQHGLPDTRIRNRSAMTCSARAGPSGTHSDGPPTGRLRRRRSPVPKRGHAIERAG